MLEKNVLQKCWREVLEKGDVEKCWRRVLKREALAGSFVEKFWRSGMWGSAGAG